MRTQALAKQPIDVQDIFERFTMDTAGEFLFGDGELNTLDRPLRKPRYQTTTTTEEGDYGGFVDAYTGANAGSMDRYYYPPIVWTVMKFFNDPLAPHVHGVKAYLEPLAKKALEKKRARVEEDNEKAEEDVSYLDHLVRSTDGMLSHRLPARLFSHV